MIVCSNHAARLHQLVRERGLGHLIHEPHDDVDQFADEICGRRQHTIAFDPEAAARTTAEGLAVAYGGPYLQMPAVDGVERCSICELTRCAARTAGGYGMTPEEFWPDAVINLVLHEARTRGLLPRPA